MSKKRSRGMITLDDDTWLIFTSPLPPWLAQWVLKSQLFTPVGTCPEGHYHSIERERIAHVIVTHQNPRRR